MTPAEKLWMGVGVWAALGIGFGCLSTPPAPPKGCLDNASLVAASPGQAVYDYPVQKHTVDARGVDWIGQALYAVNLEGSGSGCFVGGRIEGSWNPADTWDLYHDRFALPIDVTGRPITVEKVHVLNTGDAVSLKPGAPCPSGSPTRLVVRGSHFEDVHDDVVESDWLCSADVEDNLMERVYVPFAFRNRSSDPYRDGSANLVDVRSNLIRLHAFPNNYHGQTSHNGVWKWAHDGRGPTIVVRKNRFLAFDAPSNGALFPLVDKVVGCSDNVLLFAGSEAEWQQALLGGCDDDGNDGPCDGERMLALANCFSVVTKLDSESEADFLAVHWDPHVVAWKASHTADDE